MLKKMTTSEMAFDKLQKRKILKPIPVERDEHVITSRPFYRHREKTSAVRELATETCSKDCTLHLYNGKIYGMTHSDRCLGETISTDSFFGPGGMYDY